MQTLLTRAARILAGLSTLALWTAMIALILLTVIVGAEVVFRYGIGFSLVWSEPMAVLLMGWFIFLGAAVGTREGFHLSFDLVAFMAPAWMRQVMATVSDLVVAAFGAAMAWYGGELGISAWGSKMPVLGIPNGFGYVPVAMGGVLVALFALERMVRRFAGLENADAFALEPNPKGEI